MNETQTKDACLCLENQLCFPLYACAKEVVRQYREPLQALKVTFDNRPLRDLLIEAIRYGNQPETKARLYHVVDKSLDRQALRDLIEENALTEDTMDVHRVMAIREEMERMEAHKLQPHFVEAFFIEAFTALGGVIRRREEGRYEIVSVPYKIRNRDQIIGFGTPVASRYERICFDKAWCNIQGLPVADQICPGHPLLEATIDLIREQNADVMKRGAIMMIILQTWGLEAVSNVSMI